MIRELIDQAIKNGSSVTVTYSKDGEASRDFHLIRPSYSPKYGKNYIVGYCHEYESELTFKIDNIIDTDIEWVDVFPPKYCAKQDGLYLVACRSDMHLEYELRRYNKGEDIIASYQNEDGVESSYYQDDLLAYHYIPYFKEVDNKTWLSIDKELEDNNVHFVTFAYKLIGETAMEYDEEYDYQSDKGILPSKYRLCNANSNEICYTFDFVSKPIGEFVKSKNVEILAYNCCSFYKETDHSNHWELAKKMGIIKE